MVGEAADLQNADQARAAFTATAGGLLTFELLVRDNHGASSTDRVNVTVNRPPTVSASAGASPHNPGDVIVLTGVASDPDLDGLVLVWSLQPGAPASPTIQLREGEGLLVNCTQRRTIELP